MSAHYRWHPNVEAVEMDGEWIILQANHNTITRLNETGGVVWSLLQEGSPLDSIVAALTHAFAVDRVQAAADIAAFISELQNADVVVAEG